MLVESFVCPACGAPTRAAPRSLVVYCEHCGAVAAYNPGGKPSALPADRDREERWLAAAVALGDLRMASPEEPTQFVRVTRASNALVQSSPGRDPVGVAHELLLAWRAYYAWAAASLSEHEALLRSEAFVRSSVRTALRSAAIYLGEGVIARLRHEVLGDSIIPACGNCGAPLEGANVATCPFCGTALRAEADDPWVASVVAQWAKAAEGLRREGKLDEVDAPLAAIQITFFAVTLGSGKVRPEAAFRLLARLVPWVTKARMLEAIRMLQGSIVPAAKETMARTRALIEMSWPATARPPRSELH